MATAADAQVAVIDAPGPFTLKDWAKAPVNEPKVESDAKEGANLPVC
jgi:hypothetical protein